MRQQMLGVQARIFDPAFFEIGGGGLQNVEHRHKPRAPNAVILSRTDGEGPLRRSERGRAMRGSSVRAGLALSARLGMTINKDARRDRKSTRLNSSHRTISYAVFCLKKKKKKKTNKHKHTTQQQN